MEVFNSIPHDCSRSHACRFHVEGLSAFMVLVGGVTGLHVAVREFVL